MRTRVLAAAVIAVLTALTALTTLTRPATGATAPSGWGATDIESAYRLSTHGGSGRTVAVVAAYDAPTLEQDLGVYRRTYGLPACTVAGGCLRKVNQRGEAGPLPPPDEGWAFQVSSDAEMISAACPRCRVLVVEADDGGAGSLYAATDTAVRLGAHSVVIGFGEREFAGERSAAAHFRHPGHAIVTEVGDEGFTAAPFPANLDSVTAVGGTSLARAPGTSRGWTEKAWGLGGSGCSAYVAKPSWQHDGHCPGRTVADVSAVAQNLAVYDTYGRGGWLLGSGTDLSASIIAGVFGVTGHSAPSLPYAHRGALFDVTAGTNDVLGGRKCGHDYLCTARRGYDAPTGLGTPNGVGGF